jgi:type 1 glutamine amidotransferase
MTWTRREMLGATVTAAIAASPLVTWAADAASQPAGQIGKGKRVLFFTKSQGFAHSVVTRKPGEEFALAERLLKQWVEAAGYDLTISKDGSIFTPENKNIATHDAFIFYTSGDLTKPPALPTSDKTPAMTEAGKAALLEAIANGKGFVGLHSASDTFQDIRRKTDPVTIAKAGTVIDPFNRMLGAEFTSHSKQQSATIRTTAVTRAFPGIEDLKEFEMLEEWYAFTNLAPDLHVLLVQDTTSMKADPKTGLRDVQYRGAPYPETWARMHNKGRVFYTGMGHRGDVWNSARYQQLVMAGIAWSCRSVGADVQGNLSEACPALAKA